MDLNMVAHGGATLKVFSATKARDREVLGEKVTEWLRRERLVGIDVEVRSSSDAAFHCLSITVLAESA